MKVPALMSLGLIIAFQSIAQTEKSPSFDVVSVKPVQDPAQGLPAGFSMSPHRSPGRLSWVTNSTLLLRYAYGLPDWQIVRTDKNNESFYAIDATMDPSATENQIRAMLQKLLTDRFQLSSHRETKDVQGYALVVAKNGPRIKAAVPGETPSMPEYFAGKAPADFAGFISVTKEGAGTSALTGRGVSMAQLAGQLSATLGAPVIDQTAMTGNYYFGFKFLSVRNSPADDVPGATIFTALQEELGLRLEKQKDSVEMLVIDHLGKPSEN